MIITRKKTSVIPELFKYFVFILLPCLPVQSFSQTSCTTNLIQFVAESKEPCKEIKKFADLEKSKAIEPLINLLKSQDDTEVQKCIAETLAMIDINRSIAILISSLTDKDLLAASRSAIALGIIKDKRAVSPLLTALFESNIPCPAATALGMIKDSQAFDSLLKAVEHEKYSIRSCAIQGLALYGDPRACEILTEAFMKDTDMGVQIIAREARESLNCPPNDKSSTKNKINDKYCSLGQRLIDIATPLLENATGIKDWQKLPEWKNATEEIFQGHIKSAALTSDEEKDFEMMLAVYSLVVEWGENVLAYHLEPETQKMPQNGKDVTKLIAVKNNVAALHQLCPNLIFPDYEALSD